MFFWNLRFRIKLYLNKQRSGFKTFWWMGYDIQSNIYRLKFGVIQGFPALRKAVTVYLKKYDIFHVFDIANQLLNVTPLSRYFVWLMNERQSRHHSQSKVICRNFFGLWLLNTKKISIANRQWRSNFPWRRRKPKYEKKTRKLRIQWIY